MIPTQLSPKTLDKLLRRYMQGEGKVALCREFRIRESRFDILARDNGVKVRDRHARIRTLREDAFDDLRSAAAAYWYGFLLGDGSIVPRGGTWQISVTLQGTDLGHLEKLKAFMCSENKITFYRRTAQRKSGSAIWQVTSKALGDSLIRRGFAARKSFTAVIPEEGAKSRHFWRGLVDADGTLGCYGGNTPGRRRLGLCGSKPVVEAFRKWVADTWGGDLPSVVPHCNIFYLSLNGKIATAVARELYHNADPSLERKQAIVDAWD